MYLHGNFYFHIIIFPFSKEKQNKLLFILVNFYDLISPTKLIFLGDSQDILK